MKLNLLSGSNKCPLSVSYEHHKEESKKLIIYNISSNTIKSSEIKLLNANKQTYSYKRERLEKKTGNLLDYCKEPDLEGNLFSGKLESVIIQCSFGKFKFSPETDQKFNLI